ncbi:zinc finger protein OZF-like isoform X2 [Malaya genurostris]|uniref:zinc finger protein OZF-like isoform X2 n=1 Tax=Malaya genurostris TaxID=325434 RepID=UPI0026F3D66A|nr:zinc finger protein OZF-like isoform X2 [Malaya genurostris]
MNFFIPHEQVKREGIYLQQHLPAQLLPPGFQQSHSQQQPGQTQQLIQNPFHPQGMVVNLKKEFDPYEKNTPPLGANVVVQHITQQLNVPSLLSSAGEPLQLQEQESSTTPATNTGKKKKKTKAAKTIVLPPLPEGFIVKIKEEYNENYVRTVTKIPEDQFIRTIKPPGKKERKYHDYNVISEYRCDMCGKYFKDKYKLNYHVRIHSPELSHRCDVCGKVFAHQSTLSNHKRIHSGERAFKCATCGKAFVQSSALSNHTKIHTGERPHECLICGISFIQKINLIYHIRIHSNERPYRCNICNKSFIQQSHIKNHMKVHKKDNPLDCSICGKSYTDLNELTEHYSSHTVELPFRCQTCGKCFAQANHLKIHKKNFCNKN